MDYSRIYSNLNDYISFITSSKDYSYQEQSNPLDNAPFLTLIAGAYAKTNGHSQVRNYFLFKKFTKQLTATLSLPFKIKLFSKKLPSNAYYVHNKNKYFEKQGVYISKRTLNNFSQVLRLIIHELCHYYVCISPQEQNVFRLTNQLKQLLLSFGVNPLENSDMFAIFPTEYFALCLESRVAEKLYQEFGLSRFRDCVSAEKDRLNRGILEFNNLNAK